MTGLLFALRFLLLSSYMSLLYDVWVRFTDNSLGVRDSENAGHLRWKTLYFELCDLTFFIFSYLHCVLPFSLCTHRYTQTDRQTHTHTHRHTQTHTPLPPIDSSIQLGFPCLYCSDLWRGSWHKQVAVVSSSLLLFQSLSFALKTHPHPHTPTPLVLVCISM